MKRGAQLRLRLPTAECSRLGFRKPVELRWSGEPLAAVPRRLSLHGFFAAFSDHLLVVSFGSASKVTSTWAPGFRATASPVGEVREFSTRISRKR